MSDWIFGFYIGEEDTECFIVHKTLPIGGDCVVGGESTIYEIFTDITDTGWPSKARGYQQSDRREMKDCKIWK